MVFSDNGIIKRAQGAADAQKEAQDKDTLTAMMAGYEVEKLTSSKSLLDYFTEQKTKGDISNVTANGENGVLVTLNNGTQYKVNEDGTITPNKGISLSQTTFNIQLEEDEAGKIKEEVTKTLTASLTGIEGTIKWTSSDETVATVSPKEGTNVTVKALAKGTTTITASLADGTYPVTCKVTLTVKKPLAADEVAYTDSNGNKYGWEHINEFSASILSNANSVTTNNDGVMQATGTMNGNTVTIPVGTQMTVQVTQGSTKKAYTVRVLGFKYDDLTSGGKAGITFDFVELLPNAQMNSSADNTEGWGGSGTESNDGGCALRGTLNSTTLASLNNKDYIKAVNKTYYLGNKSTETRTKSDKLWLLACSEIWPK
ncbi:MAG: Ig-like domain-containing protein, partial [Clostridia bacterium]|nr:Ig-like domain-containing protein [Clostridia bacterium]